jgi:hypothetical protein
MRRFLSKHYYGGLSPAFLYDRLLALGYCNLPKLSKKFVTFLQKQQNC